MPDLILQTESAKQSRALQQRIVDFHFDTVWAIADSQWVHRYVVGYTSGPAMARFNAGYRAQQHAHIVTLANNLTKVQAMELERRLQDKIKGCDRRTHPYRKYDDYRRELPYAPSPGRSSVDPAAKVHSVYMSWQSVKPDS